MKRMESATTSKLSACVEYMVPSLAKVDRI